MQYVWDNPWKRWPGLETTTWVGVAGLDVAEG